MSDVTGMASQSSTHFIDPYTILIKGTLLGAMPLSNTFVGTMAVPKLIDIDGDGDLDVAIGGLLVSAPPHHSAHQCCALEQVDPMVELNTTKISEMLPLQAMSVGPSEAPLLLGKFRMMLPSRASVTIATVCSWLNVS